MKKKIHDALIPQKYSSKTHSSQPDFLWTNNAGSFSTWRHPYLINKQKEEKSLLGNTFSQLVADAQCDCCWDVFSCEFCHSCVHHEYDFDYGILQNYGIKNDYRTWGLLRLMHII